MIVAVLENNNRGCWGECNGKQGPCLFCGAYGMCCTRKAGWTDFSNGCENTFGGKYNHACGLPGHYFDRFYRTTMKLFFLFIIFMFCQIVFLEFHRWLRDWMFWCWTRTARSSKIGTDCEMLQGRDANLEARVGWLEHRCKMMESSCKHSKLVTLISRKKIYFS